VKPSNVLIAVMIIAACLIPSCAGPSQAPQPAPTEKLVPVKPCEKPTPAEPAKKAPPTTEPAEAEKPAPPAAKPEPAPEPTTTTMPAGAPAEPRVIATVGKVNIMSDRLDKALAKAPKNLPADKLAEHKQRLLKRWIEDELISAQLNKMEFTDEEIQAEKDKLVRWLVNREMRKEYMKKRAEAKAQAKAAEQAATTSRPAESRPAPVEMPPRPTKEQIDARVQEVLDSPEQAARMIRQYEESQNLDDAKMTQKFKYNILMQRVSTPEKVEEFIKSHPISFFDGTTVKASHILIATKIYDPPEVRQAARKKAYEIAESIRNGTITFEEAAKKNSDGPFSARGGDLGSFQLNQMVPPFALAVDALKVGEVSDPVETFFGWHVIKVTERTDGNGTVSEKVKKRLPRLLRGIAIRQLLRDALKDNPVTIYE